MARKLDPTARRQGTAKPRASKTREANEIGILNPELTLSVAGRQITVREYSWMQGLQVRAAVAPMAADIDAMYMQGGEGLTEDIMAVFAVHAGLLNQAIAASCGLTTDEITALSNDDGERLLYAWWAVCGPFFLRLVVRRQVERMERLRAVASVDSLHGASSSTSSRPTGTGRQTRSAGGSQSGS